MGRNKIIRCIFAALIAAAAVLPAAWACNCADDPIETVATAHIFALHEAEYVNPEESGYFTECDIMGETHYVAVLQVRNTSDTTGNFTLTAQCGLSDSEKNLVALGYSTYNAAPQSAEEALVDGEFLDLTWQDGAYAELHTATLASGEAFYVAVSVKADSYALSPDKLVKIRFSVSSAEKGG